MSRSGWHDSGQGGVWDIHQGGMNDGDDKGLTSLQWRGGTVRSLMSGLSFAAVYQKPDCNKTDWRETIMGSTGGKKKSGYNRRWVFEESCPNHGSHSKEVYMKTICFKADTLSPLVHYKSVSDFEQSVPKFTDLKSLNKKVSDEIKLTLKTMFFPKAMQTWRKETNTFFKISYFVLE